ncbi:hypothetical protein B0H12DRAFT_1011459, partial [Mycena haematopus]
MASFPENNFPSSRLLSDRSTAARIRELVRSHSTPPDDIPLPISELSQELLRYDVEISRCEDEILKFRTHMGRVESERAALKDYLVGCRGLLAPIRRMPTEVLVAIFALCADDLCDDARWRAIERLAQKPLLTLSQVCVRWHQVALETPTLWDTLVLQEMDRTATPEMVEKELRLLRIFLDRGKDCPLHLVLHINIPPLLELLTKHSERWKTAD